MGCFHTRKGIIDVNSFVFRFLVGVIALGGSVMIAVSLLIGYVFFGVASNLLVCIIIHVIVIERCSFIYLALPLEISSSLDE